MYNNDWDKVKIPPGDEHLLWELFHENSKTGRYDIFPPDEVVVAYMQSLYDALPFGSYPLIELPTTRTALNLSLEQAILSRETARAMEPCPLSLESLGTLLYYAYGVTRDNKNTIFPRPFRTVPSGGGLFPLEIFFYTAHVPELAAGLYHFNPAEHHLRLLREGDLRADIASALVQKNIAYDASVIFFITALFERTIFKYGDRGYRFIFLEAGHAAQNINLVAGALGLGVVNVGGYFDRDIDRFLHIDGVTHSTIYMNAIGRSVG